MLRTGVSIRFPLVLILANHWWDFVRSYGRWIRPVVFTTIRRILACRTPTLGCHLYECPECGDRRVVPHSCKSRFCPTCGKHRTDVWANEILGQLLPVPYHHLVLSVPWQLRPVILNNRVVGLGIVMRAALLSITDWAHKVHGMRMGVIGVLHTFGSDLRFHPHVHLIVTGGGLTFDGKRWITTNPKFLMAHGGLKQRWRYHVVRMFREAHKQGQLRFPGTSAPGAQYHVFNGLLRKLYTLTWYAHIGASLLDPRFTVRYIGRYTKRAVLAEYRITHYDGKVVRYQFKDYANGGKRSYKTLPVLAFIGRLIRHVPDEGFHTIRHAGLFATAHKREFLELARRALARTERPRAQPTQPQPEPPQTWRDRQTAYRGADPFWCQACNCELVLVEIVFGPHAYVASLFEDAGVPTQPWCKGEHAARAEAG